MQQRIPSSNKGFFLRKSLTLFVFLLTCSVCMGQSRWERIFQTFPNETETSYGVVPTIDNGFFMLCSRSENGQADAWVYLLKVDADGTPLFTKDIATGRGLKLKTLPDSNIVVMYRQPILLDSFHYRFALCNPQGDVLMDKPISNSTAIESKAWDFTPVHTGFPNGGFAIPVREKFQGTTQIKVNTFDANGILQINAFQIQNLPSPDSLYVRSMIQAADGHYYGVGFTKNTALIDADPIWFRMHHGGGNQAIRVYDEPDSIAWQHYDMWHDIAEAGDGNFWVLGLKDSWKGPEFDSLYMAKVDTQGTVLFQKIISSRISNLEFFGEDHSEIIPMPDGGMVIMFDHYDPWNTDEDYAIARLDAQANVVWLRKYGRGKRFAEAPFGITAVPEGGYAMAGVFKDLLFNTEKSYLIRTDSNGLVFTNYIQGHVFADANTNCSYDSLEPPLGGWLVSLENAGQNIYETITDVDGSYQIPSDTGHVTVRVHPPAPYWDACSDTLLGYMPLPFDTATLDFGIDNIAACPQLEVDIAAPFMRRCFQNYYAVSYANRGTVDIQNATIQVELDPYLNYVGASIPLYWTLGNTYTFNVGDLPIGTLGQFQIQVEVDCSAPLGATHCSAAHILPDSTCSPTTWSGGIIDVDGTCANDTLAFTIRNTGTGLTTTTDFIIIEEHIILRVGSVGSLAPGQDTTIRIPGNGKTHRIEATQEPGAPGPSHPAVSVEGCGVDSTGANTMGYITIFPNEDGNPFTATECLENIGSFDPNDKMANPKGYGNKHYVRPNTPIDYKIRFQNTGTDTAFTVVIRDTLSEWLDLRTLVQGAASHDYEFELLPNRVAKFTFRDILLPDSTTNEPLSHGFVQFQIRHVSNLPLGTRIDNSAAIYFDFNAAVITNTYHLTVDTGILTVPTWEPVSSAPVRLTLVPNPMNTISIVQFRPQSPMNPAEGGDLFLEVYAVDGRLVRTVDGGRMTVDGALVLRRDGLLSGFYIVKMRDRRGRVLGVGKVVVE